MQILGPPSASLSKIRENLAQFNPHPRFINEMLPALYIKAMAYGIDPVVMIAQSLLETDRGWFTGVLDPSFFNTAGIKTRKGGDDKDPNAHQRFADWYVGAQAQAEHLYAYMQLDPPAPIVDPRFGIVRGNPVYMPGITTVLGLNAWATAPRNGERILNVAQRVNAGGVVQGQVKKTVTTKHLEI
jgi:Mannosyl-glycoprotein endo-beta-N-acetylglucosaminidase